MKKILFLQYLMCSFLLIFGIFLSVRSSVRAVRTGTFDSASFFNDTFEDLSNNCFAQPFYD